MQEANLIRLNPLNKSRLHDGPTSIPKPAGSVGGVGPAQGLGRPRRSQMDSHAVLWLPLESPELLGFQSSLLEQLVKLPLPHQNHRTEGTPVLCPQHITGK